MCDLRLPPTEPASVLEEVEGLRLTLESVIALDDDESVYHRVQETEPKLQQQKFI
jgi:hypothetical protein